MIILSFISVVLCIPAVFGSNSSEKSKNGHRLGYFEPKKECSRHCTEDKKIVCLYEENVPLCYADCKKQVRL